MTSRDQGLGTRDWGMRIHPVGMVAAIACMFASISLGAADGTNLTEEEVMDFLRKAKVVTFKPTAKGVTSPWHLTLSDGKMTHDAAFQSIDERKMRMEFATRTEMNFRDSYHFNIAAYQVAKLLGLGGMVPVAIERSWNGSRGSLCWWVAWKLDESMRQKRNIQPPDLNAWNKQLNKMWVFSELIYDTDRNQTNLLITEDWKLWMVDFSRAFRRSRDLLEPGHLVMCDRQLLEGLRQLNEAEVLEVTKPHLGNDEVNALMARRDKIVAHFERLIAQKGEDKTLY